MLFRPPAGQPSDADPDNDPLDPPMEQAQIADMFPARYNPALDPADD